jgi:hypothetical protein
MAFPLTPADLDKVVVNGIKYIYYASIPGWRRDFNNALNQLFLVGYNQSISTSTGDLVTYGGIGVGGNATIGGTLSVYNTATFYYPIAGTITTAIDSSHLTGGTTGALVYQTGTNRTGFIPIGPAGSIMQSNGVIPVWTASAAISVATAITATNISGGLVGQIPYQSAQGITAFSSNLTFDTTKLSIATGTASTGTTNGALVVTGGVGISGNGNIGGNLTVSGNFTVNGTTTFVNSTNLDVTDKNITLAKGSVSGIAADGAGITVEGPATSPTILYSNANDAWELNKKLNGTSATLSEGVVSTSTATGTLVVAGGIGVNGAIYAVAVNGAVTGTVGAGTRNSGLFTTLGANGIVSITSSTASTNTVTGALIVTGGVGIGGNLNVGGQISGTITSALSATTSTFAYFATTSSYAYTATTSTYSLTATTATNINGGSAGQIPFQTSSGLTSFSSNFTYNSGSLINSVAVTSTLPAVTFGLNLSNSLNDQSPAIKLAGNTNGIALVSSFGTLRISSDVNLASALMTISGTQVNIPLTTSASSSSSGALVVAGGVGIAKDLYVAGTIYQTGVAVTTLTTVPASSTSTGITGQMASDGSHTYICYATNTWRRWANSTF